MSLSTFIATDDESLVAAFQAGDPAALDVLVARYRFLARSRSRSYFLAGADREDTEQEALIGLCRAARDFRADRQVSFRSFAELCITRQIQSAVKAAGRRKHQALNTYLSLSAPAGAGDDAELPLEAVLSDATAPDPGDEVAAAVAVAELARMVDETLSGLETEVLGRYVDGETYEEIGQGLGRQAKAVDNALQRVKRKLGARLEETALVA